MDANLPDSYVSLATLGKSDEIIINKSKFVGYAKMTSSEDEAIAFIEQVKAEHPMASSICYGYQCGYQSQIQRYHDGHEPVGGKPILSAIKLKNLINTTCVVTRYFGGIKLGVGGLARAFSGAAVEAITAGAPTIYEQGKVISITYDYLYDGKISYLLDNAILMVDEKKYLDKITINIEMKNKYFDEFMSKLSTITNNTHSIIITSEKYICNWKHIRRYKWKM